MVGGPILLAALASTAAGGIALVNAVTVRFVQHAWVPDGADAVWKLPIGSEVETNGMFIARPAPGARAIPVRHFREDR